MHPPNPSASRACSRIFRLCIVLVLGPLLTFVLDSSTARAQSTAQPTSHAPATQAGSQTAPDNPSAEISSRDEAPTFKINVNLVLVRVGVRGAKGKANGNLHQADFQLFDNRKPQIISQGSV